MDVETQTRTEIRLNGSSLLNVPWNSLAQHWTFCQDLKEHAEIELDKWIQLADVASSAKLELYMQAIIDDSISDVYSKLDWTDVDRMWLVMEKLGIKDEYHGDNIEMRDYFSEFLQGTHSPFTSIRDMVMDFKNRKSALWKDIVTNINNSMLARWDNLADECDNNMHRMNPHIHRTTRELRSLIVKYWKYEIVDETEIDLADVEDCSSLVATIKSLKSSDVAWLLNYLGEALTDIWDHMVCYQTTDEMDKVLTALWHKCKKEMMLLNDVSDQVKMSLIGIRKFTMTGTAQEWIDLTETIDGSQLSLKCQERILYHFVLNIIGIKFHGKWTSNAMSELLIHKNNAPVKNEDWSIAKLWVQWLHRLHGADDIPVAKQIAHVWNKMGLVNKFKFGEQVFKYYAYGMDNFNRAIPRTMVKYCQKWVLSEPWVFENVNEQA